jgi:hypothetical protein
MTEERFEQLLDMKRAEKLNQDYSDYAGLLMRLRGYHQKMALWWRHIGCEPLIARQHEKRVQHYDYLLCLL